MLIVQRVTYIAYNLHDGKLIKVKKDILCRVSLVLTARFKEEGIAAAIKNPEEIFKAKSLQAKIQKIQKRIQDEICKATIFTCKYPVLINCHFVTEGGVKVVLCLCVREQEPVIKDKHPNGSNRQVISSNACLLWQTFLHFVPTAEMHVFPPSLRYSY